MSDNVYGSIGYVDDIPMPKVAQPPELFSFSPRVRILVQKFRSWSARSRQVEASEPYIGAFAG